MRSLHHSVAFQSQPLLAADALGATHEDAAPAAERDNREWTISEMSRHYGLTLRALRFYEARGLLKPHRFGGARFYTARDRSRLTLILAAKQMGFTLTETAQMMGKSSDAEIADLPLSQRAVKTQIDYLERSRETIETALVQLRARLARMAEAGG